MLGRAKKSGFTLVEILIVVVILGILAAIVIPQFSSASQTAKASSLKSQLQTIRSQLELYQVQHNGMYPLLSELQDDWRCMTLKTDIPDGSGASFTNLDDADAHYGPYLQKPPANGFIPSTGGADIDVADISAADAYSAVGWGYDQTTGKIKAMIPASVDAADLGLNDDDDFILESPEDDD